VCKRRHAVLRSLVYIQQFNLYGQVGVSVKSYEGEVLTRSKANGDVVFPDFNFNFSSLQPRAP
jgi:hypothetical protein